MELNPIKAEISQPKPNKQILFLIYHQKLWSILFLSKRNKNLYGQINLVISKKNLVKSKH